GAPRDRQRSIGRVGGARRVDDRRDIFRARHGALAQRARELQQERFRSRCGRRRRRWRRRERLRLRWRTATRGTRGASSGHEPIVAQGTEWQSPCRNHAQVVATPPPCGGRNYTRGGSLMIRWVGFAACALVLLAVTAVTAQQVVTGTVDRIDQP